MPHSSVRHSLSRLQDGTFTAIGQVHKPTGPDHTPRNVGQYWEDYDPGLTSSDPKPATFIGYVFAGLGKATAAGEADAAVAKLAEGVCRLAGMAGESTGLVGRSHGHRHVLNLLAERPEIRSRYVDMIVAVAANRVTITRDTWESEWCGVVKAVAECLSGGTLKGAEANDFLRWPESVTAPQSPASRTKSLDNVYRYSRNGKDVHFASGPFIPPRERRIRRPWS